MGSPFERLNRLQPGSPPAGAEASDEAEEEEAPVVDATPEPTEVKDDSGEAPADKPAPWWTRAPVQDPAGDPASGRPARVGGRSSTNSLLSPEPVMGVPAKPAADAPEGSAPVRVRAATPNKDSRPSSDLAVALRDERARLQSQRAALGLEREQIDTQIEAIDSRVEHVEALLGDELAAGPPVALRSIGSLRDVAAA